MGACTLIYWAAPNIPTPNIRPLKFVSRDPTIPTPNIPTPQDSGTYKYNIPTHFCVYCLI